MYSKHNDEESNDLKKSDTWKIELTATINFMSSNDNDEEGMMHSKSDNIEIMINDKADEVIERLFQSLLSRYQIGLETSLKGDFIFGCVHLLYYRCNKINFKQEGSYIYSPDWIKKNRSNNKPYDNANICYICKEKFEYKYSKNINVKLGTIVIIQ